ncbi:hypothetical protein V8C43DRAFT_272071 [Trichoderma afarasin]
MHLTLPNKAKIMQKAEAAFMVSTKEEKQQEKKSVNLAETGRVPGQYNGEYAMHVLCIRFPDDHSPLFRF